MRYALLLGVLLWTGMSRQVCQAQPAFTPDASVLKFDEIGLYEVGYAYRGKPEQQFPLGWSGVFNNPPGIAAQAGGEQNGKQTFLLHPPWRNGTGITFQQFKVNLPAAQHITLRGATAMRETGTEGSDGVTFRVFVDGQKLLDVNRTDTKWQPFEFDLTPQAGKTVVIRFETDPGPKDNSSFDFAVWGDRALVLDGYSPRPRSHPAAAPLEVARVLPQQNSNPAPSGGFTGKQTLTLRNDIALLTYTGPDGNFEYQWQRPRTAQDALFGALKLSASPGKAPADEVVPLANDAKIEWTQPAQWQTSRWEHKKADITCVSVFKVGTQTATVRTTGHLVGKSLEFDVTCDQPLVTEMDMGSWGPVLRRRHVTVPYYSGQINYLPSQNLFTNSFLDWTTSAASEQQGTRALYQPLTDGTRLPLRERAIYAPGWNLDEAFPNIPNPPSPYLTPLGQRIVLDVWGGQFTDIAQKLETLHGYGLTNCAVIIHDWQHSGYDNGLPQHYPANAKLGGDDGMKTLVATAKRLGYLIALHENYVDYYTNYPDFNENDIALDSAGKRINAWYNSGTKMQSFAEKPNAIMRLAATQSPEIARRYGSNMNYLDVHSAVPPWFHVDYRAGEQGAGMFQRTWDVHRQLWQFERQTFGGPVLGEGSNHWYWSGYLDGTEAQFGQGWPDGQGMTAPLMVDFDLLKMHPLEFNHGMGYYERWWSKVPWGSTPPVVALDQYRMQEVAYGHAGFLGAATWANLPYAWLEHNLMTPLTSRYATAKPASIRYEVAGRWQDATAAAKANLWNRVQVAYDNGLTITANDRPEPLQIAGYTLPRFGWLAQGAGLTAYTAQRNGVVADYAATATSIFANARPATDWNQGGAHLIRPSVADFSADPVASRTIHFTYHWQVGETPKQNYAAFVHFTKPKGADNAEDIMFQQDHPLTTPSSQWQAGQTVSDGPYTMQLPANVADGDYDWKIGLLDANGARLTLGGVADGNSRVRLGALHVRDGGKTVTFDPETGAGSDLSALQAQDLNTNEKVVDFGPVRTNGSVLVRREGNQWVLQTLPRDRAFTLELSSQRFGQPRQIQTVGGAAATVAPVAQGGYWGLPLNGAREYRWAAG